MKIAHKNGGNKKNFFNSRNHIKILLRYFIEQF